MSLVLMRNALCECLEKCHTVEVSSEPSREHRGLISFALMETESLGFSKCICKCVCVCVCVFIAQFYRGCQNTESFAVQSPHRASFFWFRIYHKMWLKLFCRKARLALNFKPFLNHLLARQNVHFPCLIIYIKLLGCQEGWQENGSLKMTYNTIWLVSHIHKSRADCDIFFFWLSVFQSFRAQTMINTARQELQWEDPDQVLKSTSDY